MNINTNSNIKFTDIMKKKLAYTIISMFLLTGNSFSQNSAAATNSTPLFYSIIVNNVPDGFNYPLIGFVNNCNGSHKSLNLGFINSIAYDFSGLQAGFINSTGHDMKGVQAGFINSTGNEVQGIQSGFINSVRSVKGIQNGFINSTKGEIYGLQNGFLNSAEDLTGIQNGFINVIKYDLRGMQNGFINRAETMKGIQDGFINVVKYEALGLQNGFINTAGSLTGVQLGFINATEKLNGVQIGFINTVDSLENGVPIGFLSFVRHGGYHAFEVSTDERYPVNLSYKIGVEKFYSFPIVSYNPDLVDKYAVGFGFGSNLAFSKRFSFNPEIMSQFALSADPDIHHSLSASLGVYITPKLQLLAGPSLVWSQQYNDRAYYSFEEFLDEFTLTAGFKAALRYRL